jgi:KaiC/GvpD/RAD55 family RecA-like ATPase
MLIVSLLLAVAIGFSFPFAPSTYSQSSTVTTTVSLENPPAGQCTERSIAFSAQAGKEITGTFGSDGSISFYILTQTDLNAIQNCRLPASSRPIYSQENVVGHDNRYSSLPFPANSTYYFVFLYHVGTSPNLSGYVTAQLTYPSSITIIGGTAVQSSTTRPSSATATTSIPLSSNTSSSSSETSQAGSLVTPGNFGTIGVIALVVVVALVGSVVAFTRRKKTPLKTVTVQEKEPPAKAEPSQPIPEAPSAQETALSTGYSDLDRLLVGGLPEGYAVLLLSPPCDERDLLLRKLISSALSSQIPTFYVSNDPNRIQDLVGRYWKDFYALSPVADKILSPPANLYKISNFDNLSEFNISLTKTIEGRVKQKAAKRLMIIDLLTDILLQHKALTTRKWLSDFIAKRKGEGFTALAFLNPLVSPKEETQTLIDVFDGVIEIYERELRERARRFLVVKRMYGRKYSESELMLDKDKLF